METKNLIIICATVILAVVIVLSAFIYVNMGNETHISSNIADTLQNGDEIVVKLVDKDNKPLVNKTISLNFKDENGKGNAVSYDLLTNDKGEVYYNVNLTEGKYVFSADYAGETFIGSSSLNKSVEVKKDVKTANLSSTDTTKTAKTKTYTDWQEDYETGRYDEDGNPIYRSIMSTSGGQYEPGIYECYWSANGPISERRIG
ncbi:hypothetical protein mru_0489 [Methanobrevibacter ruminantium M1]|uniref:Adhesin-like protein n=1 Tax=Methanobrevibacter ruminantium (strain ATCC 35063 / DSM 1093 / JCM 13430 / OCM 146 / M1) TaxID=634498 RepID=D3E157_METRM|nr:hypothetical protein [Methanobrevibacter ruminantium]ADC46340.1 hypothetical protein mru_0489 [Methanobrevibacter ruminantium M1]